jgi:hemerythrin-like metal-binding protein
VTVSVGAVCMSASSVADPESVLEFADKSLYRAKTRGRNRVDFELDLIPATHSQPAPMGLVQLMWREGAESGNATIDAQHKGLFAAANEVLSAIVEGRSKEACTALLEELGKSIETHLRDEEVILRAAGYRATDEHARGHDGLLERAAAMAAEYARDELSVHDAFSFLAYDVIVRHMFVEDVRFFEHLAGTSASLVRVRY